MILRGRIVFGVALTFLWWQTGDQLEFGSCVYRRKLKLSCERLFTTVSRH
ncbi:hypothetical protein IC582_023553 [Cucumis melo]